MVGTHECIDCVEGRIDELTNASAMPSCRRGEWIMVTRRQLAHFGAAAPLLRAGMVIAAADSSKAVRIGVLNDQSSLYADVGGPGSIVTARLGVADSGPAGKGRKTEVLVANHQNKPDVAWRPPSLRSGSIPGSTP